MGEVGSRTILRRKWAGIYGIDTECISLASPIRVQKERYHLVLYLQSNSVNHDLIAWRNKAVLFLYLSSVPFSPAQRLWRRPASFMCPYHLIALKWYMRWKVGLSLWPERRQSGSRIKWRLQSYELNEAPSPTSKLSKAGIRMSEALQATWSGSASERTLPYLRQFTNDRFSALNCYWTGFSKKIILGSQPP